MSESKPVLTALSGCDKCKWCADLGCNQHEDFTGPLARAASHPPVQPDRPEHDPEDVAAAFHEAMALRGWKDEGTHAVGEALCQNMAALVAMDDNLGATVPAMTRPTTKEERSAVEWTLNLHRTEVAMGRECVNRWEHLLIDATLASTAAPSQPVPSGLDELRWIILRGGLRLPELDHWRERATSKPSDPDDVRWDCFCGYAGSPESVERHWSAMLAATTAPPAEEAPRSVWIVARAAEPTPGVMSVYDNEDDAREDWAIRTGRGSRPDLERKYVVESWSVGGGIALGESNR